MNYSLFFIRVRFLTGNLNLNIYRKIYNYTNKLMPKYYYDGSARMIENKKIRWVVENKINIIF